VDSFRAVVERIHRVVQPARLNYFADSWPLIEGMCPCDLHFLDYLDRHAVKGRRIFHFGSGEHHILGRTNHARGAPNEVLALTLSAEEHQQYVDFVINTPRAARSYKVVFADIYTLTPSFARDFDLVTLFHLCEYYSEKQRRYAPLDDASLLELFVDNLNPGGRIFFYEGSWGYRKTSRIMAGLVDEGRLRVDERFMSLVVCSVPGRD
jgi:SAM-dependent methyltransferase